jgi:hypothetical protein
VKAEKRTANATSGYNRKNLFVQYPRRDFKLLPLAINDPLSTKPLKIKKNKTAV